MSDYFFVDSEDGYGRVFVPRGPWKPSYNHLVAKENVHVVRLSSSMGWRGQDLEFLRDLPFLRGVEIYSWDVRDASVIGSLSELRLVGLDCDLRKQIDFTALPKLEVVKGTWKKPLESLLHCKGLKHLNLSNWPEEDLRSLSAMTKLTKLLLTSRKLSSLRGISSLEALKWLDLHACPKLTSLEELRSCVSIRHLEITSCGAVDDVSPIGDLHELRELALDGCKDLDTLTCIQGCENLEQLSFLGTTRVTDGKLSFISELPKLHSLRFTPRRHYDRKRVELLRGSDG